MPKLLEISPSTSGNILGKLIETFPEIVTWQAADRVILRQNYINLQCQQNKYIEKVLAFIIGQSRPSVSQLYEADRQYLNEVEEWLDKYPSEMDPILYEIHQSYLHHHAQIEVRSQVALICKENSLYQQFYEQTNIPEEVFKKNIFPAWENAITPTAANSLKELRLKWQQCLTEIEAIPSLKSLTGAIRILCQETDILPYVKNVILPLHDFTNEPNTEKLAQLLTLLDQASTRCKLAIFTKESVYPFTLTTWESMKFPLGRGLLMATIVLIPVVIFFLHEGEVWKGALFLSGIAAMVITSLYLMQEEIHARNYFSKLKKQADVISLSAAALYSHLIITETPADTETHSRCYSPMWSGITALWQGSRTQPSHDEENPAAFRCRV